MNMHQQRSPGGILPVQIRRRWRRPLLVAAALLLVTSVSIATMVGAATDFATPAFRTQWLSGEAIAANFWGPLSNATDGMMEPYIEAPGGQRLVQYFDKARMELTNGVLTNGLLATELITGNEQLGDATFNPLGPANVPVAGDPDNIGPTYAAIQNNAVQLRNAASPTVGASTTLTLTPSGSLTTFPSGAGFTEAAISEYDAVTGHNVPAAFAHYRAIAGIPAIGLAISEPFWSNVRVGGVSKDVLVQAFERRVLTYTPSNAAPFRVEFGNIGQHYYRWRHRSAPSPGVIPNPGGSAPLPSPTPIRTVAPNRTTVPSVTPNPGGLKP